MTEIETSNVSIVILVVILLSATYSDLREHRISNVLVLLAMFLGLAVQLGTLGSPGIIQWAGGLGVGLAIFLPFYVGGGMGAGDVKLMAAVGGFLGPYMGAVACGFSLLAGLPLVGLALLSRRLSRQSATQNTGAYDTGTHLYKQHKKKRNSNLMVTREGQPDRIPYAVAIATGAIGGLWWSGQLDQLAGVILA
jgi:prepilin peptidase CpaA